MIKTYESVDLVIYELMSTFEYLLVTLRQKERSPRVDTNRSKSPLLFSPLYGHQYNTAKNPKKKRREKYIRTEFL